ncbi:MAG: AAA family ATPase, partial [Nitrospirales bacterium]|nr:AAA family ATPase [Nitrospirales bacterium]
MKEGDLYSLATARRIVKNSDPCVSLFIWGPPGVGKSTMVREVTEELGIGLLDVRAAQLESIDLRGFPVIDPETNLASWKAFMNVLPHPKIHGGKGILFLDELNLATLDVQKACYQLINDRKVGDYALPEGWRIIAAGNELEHAEGAIIEMPHPLKNRFQHVTVEAPTS